MAFQVSNNHGGKKKGMAEICQKILAIDSFLKQGIH
jgi:hypothetical protein